MTLLGDNMNSMIFIVCYFIIGLIISSLILFLDKEIDAYNDQLLLFSLVLFYPVVVPILIIKNIVKKII